MAGVGSEAASANSRSTKETHRNRTGVKAVGSDATKRFFDCLDTNSTSEHAKWLRG